jgi:hypothetical protein
MVRKMIPLVVVALTGGLTAAAIEFLPQTLFFPVVEMSTPNGLRVTALQPGWTERSECEHLLGEVAPRLGAANCDGCKIVQRCVRGLSAATRGALSRDAIAQPSARAGNGGLIIVFSAADPNVAMGACRQSQQLSASYPVESRLECFAAGAPR